MEETLTDLTQNMQDLAQQAVLIARDDYGASLDFSTASLTTFYRLLDRAHALYASPAYAGGNPTRTIFVWGAYLGETIRRVNNAAWQENPAADENRRYSINTPTGNIFPMEQVYLRVVAGMQSTNLKAAVIEPPTRKANPRRRILLILGAAVLAVIAFIAVYYFIIK